MQKVELAKNEVVLKISTESKTVEDLALEQGIPVAAVQPRSANAAVVNGAQLKDFSADQLDELVSIL